MRSVNSRRLLPTRQQMIRILLFPERRLRCNLRSVITLVNIEIEMNKLKRATPNRSAAIALVAFGFLTSAAHAEENVQAMDFDTHAAFFSDETRQASPLDPQVFVSNPNSPAATGPQGIKHIAGVRNALIADAPDLPITNANGQSLDMSLGAWLAAKGSVTLSPLPDGREKIIVTLSGLKPKGSYSLFENHFDQKPTGFTPLDGQGTDNTFTAGANGEATVTTIAPAALTHDNAVLVVYHSDGIEHGMTRGTIGIDAHHQLIARP